MTPAAGFSANLGLLWADLPLLERIERAARAGFRAIELHWPYDTAPEEVARACAASELRLLLLNTPIGAPGEFGTAALPGREADFRAGLEQAVDYARASGADTIHVMAGNVAAHEAQALPTFVANVKAAAGLAGHHGLHVVLEPINRRDRPHYYLERLDQAAQVLAMVGEANVGLMLDLYHAAHSRDFGSPAIEHHLGSVRHVQFAGFPDRGEPDCGSLDMFGAMHALRQRGYLGWFGAEYVPSGEAEAGLGWKDRWERALAL